MDKIINVIISAVVAVAMLLGVSAFMKTPTTPTPAPGAVTGPDSYFQTETHNGITYAFNRQALSIASTTSCVFKSPSATSTLDFASVVIKTNQVAESVNLTTGTAMQASTTALSSTFTLALGAQGTFVASTTNSEATRTFNPNTFLQVNIFGGSGVASSTGTCQAVFKVL